jgi:cobalt/nickel transport system permease protein
LLVVAKGLLYIVKNFIEKTLLDIQGIFGELFYSEETARGQGLLQLLDPRVKLLSFLGFIIFVNFLQTIPELVGFIGYIIVLAVFSKVSFFRLIRWVAVVAFIFTGMVALPSLFNVVRPGEALWRISEQFYITRQGMNGAILLVLRSFSSIAIIYLLTRTTKWEKLLKSLRSLKIPALFVATLEMTHRYIFLGLETAANFFIARKSRSLGKSSSSEGRRFVAHTVGQLLIRTSIMSDEVYQAMLSRGYSGEIKSINSFKLRIVDYLWLIMNAVFMAAFIIIKIIVMTGQNR